MCCNVCTVTAEGQPSIEMITFEKTPVKKHWPHQKWQLYQRCPGEAENHESSDVWLCFPRSSTSSFMMHWWKRYSAKKQKSLRLTFMPTLMLSWYLGQQERPDWRNSSRWALWDSSVKIFRFVNLNDLKVDISTQLSSAFST